jgi:hypothetical protein
MKRSEQHGGSYSFICSYGDISELNWKQTRQRMNCLDGRARSIFLSSPMNNLHAKQADGR